MVRATIEAWVRVGVAAAAMLCGVGASAQDNFPSRVIKIVPFGTAGGPIDTIARIYADKLRERWGQAVIVEANPILITLPLTHINNAILQPKLPYDPLRDFAPLSQLATGVPMLVARADAPYNNLREFVDHARKHPGLTYGTWGNGSTAHLFGALLQRQAGIELTHVPYKSEAAAHRDMFGKVLDFAWANPATAHAQTQAGKIKPLGIAGTRRPEKKPVLPRYDALEVLDDGEFIEADDNSIGGGPKIIACNWLQHYENLVDPFHVVVLHSSFSGAQFVKEMGVLPDVTWDTVELGVRTTSIRRLPDGKVLRRLSQAALPTLRVIPSPRIGRYGRVESIGWVLPIDDHSFRIYVAGRVREHRELVKMRSRLNGRLWEELTEEEHRALPGDYEAQVSQGAIAHHSEEHLVTSDKGIAMLRRLLQKQLDLVREGKDPAGVSFDPAAPPMFFDAGNFLEPG